MSSLLIIIVWHPNAARGLLLALVFCVAPFLTQLASRVGVGQSLKGVMSRDRKTPRFLNSTRYVLGEESDSADAVLTPWNWIYM